MPAFRIKLLTRIYTNKRHPSFSFISIYSPSKKAHRCIALLSVMCYIFWTREKFANIVQDKVCPYVLHSCTT